MSIAAGVRPWSNTSPQARSSGAPSLPVVPLTAAAFAHPWVIAHSKSSIQYASPRKRPLVHLLGGWAAMSPVLLAVTIPLCKFFR